MISIPNTQGSVKIRQTCSKVLLLINYFDRRFWNFFKNAFYKKRQMFIFYKSSQIILSDHFMKYNSKGISWNMKYFHEILFCFSI